ncbi:MAG: hypothetical protein M3R07_08200 [Gemmatimonadota bacterium]|nr:hypothetical protein [Gemmatimonadota bacterium]
MTDEKSEAMPDRPVYRKTPPATPAVQAWLDGDVPREGLATADEQETADLWARINQEAETLRQRHTPIHVQSRILSSLPATPIVREEARDGGFKLSTAAAAIGGIAILAIGALIGFMLVN